jgi:integrase
LSHDHCKPVRYNRGMVRKEKRAVGTVWVFRWSEEVNGQRRQHKDVIGTTKEFPTEAAANKEADRRRFQLNENKKYLSLKAIMFGELINHYVNHELQRLSRSARKANKSYIKNWIEPNWHGHLAGGMKTMQIQEWLDKIQRPDGTKLKIKNVLSAIFSHGVRWELVERNPVCGQGGSPGHRGASTGVRQSSRVSIQRLTLAPDVVRQTLGLWRENTAYRSDEDWIFASPHYHGKTPYTYQILFRRHIRPVIERISGIKSSKEAPIGWHTLRRSLATLLISNGENVKVAQSQLRHTTPKITLELYAQAVSADQQEAHKKVVQMVLPAEFSEKLKARSVTATG